MRTTLTLDNDVAAQLHQEAERQGLPFKQVVNRAIRLGLRAGVAPADRKPFRTQARHLGLRAGIDPTKLGQLVDELETQEFVRKNSIEAPSRTSLDRRDHVASDPSRASHR